MMVDGSGRQLGGGSGIRSRNTVVPISRANGWAGLLHARAAGCVIGHSARQSEIGVMMMQWRGEAQRALLGYHESKKTDFSAYIFLTFLGQSHPGGGTPCPYYPGSTMVTR
jgi:hypothetical protein